MLGSVKDGVKVDEEENHEFLQDGQDSSKKTEVILEQTAS